MRTAIIIAPATERKGSPEHLDGVSPGNLGLGPPCHSAVQGESLSLPDCLSTGLDDELRGMCQTV